MSVRRAWKPPQVQTAADNYAQCLKIAESNNCYEKPKTKVGIWHEKQMVAQARKEGVDI